MKLPLLVAGIQALAWSALLSHLIGTATAQSFAVASIDPVRETTSAPLGGAITVNFTAAVNPATVTASTFRVAGRWSGAVSGAFEFSSGNTTVVFRPARPFFPGEPATVMLSAAVSGAATGNLVGGYTWSFWVGSAPGTRYFAPARTIKVRLANEQGIIAYGGHAADLDADGSPDLAIACEGASDLRVFLSDGCGAYSAPAVQRFPPNTAPSPVEGADLNGDGFTDLVLGNVAGNSITVLLGNGTGGFSSNVAYASGITTRGVALLDVDGDGDIDIATANRASSDVGIHINNGDGTFQPVTRFDAGGNGETAIMAGDANKDGITDLFVAHYSTNTLTEMLGDGAGGFTFSAGQPVGMQPWTIALGDFDGDGNLDAATANSGSDDMSVVRGDGAGGLLAATTLPTAVFPIAVGAGDFDGDGDLDLVVSNVSGSFLLFVNDGLGAFPARFTMPSPGAGSFAWLIDQDRDGDLDLVGLDEVNDVIYVFEHTGPTPPQVQPPSCAATLRIGNLANRAGFASAPAHDVRIGDSFFAGITAAPSTLHLIGLSTALEPGVPTPAGILNFDPVISFFLMPSLTNPAGEDLLRIPVPFGAPQGAKVALQAVVLDPASPVFFTLSNPECVMLRP